MIIVYSKPGCPQCLATCRALDRKAIPYEVIDVEQDDAAKAYLLSLGYRSLPVVETGTGHWSGFRPERIAALSA